MSLAETLRNAGVASPELSGMHNKKLASYLHWPGKRVRVLCQSDKVPNILQQTRGPEQSRQLPDESPASMEELEKESTTSH